MRSPLSRPTDIWGRKNTRTHYTLSCSFTRSFSFTQWACVLSSLPPPLHPSLHHLSICLCLSLSASRSNVSFIIHPSHLVDSRAYNEWYSLLYFYILNFKKAEEKKKYFYVAYGMRIMYLTVRRAMKHKGKAHTHTRSHCRIFSQKLNEATRREKLHTLYVARKEWWNERATTQILTEAQNRAKI